MRNKCPKCKCEEIIIICGYGECHGPIIVEETIKCKQCGNVYHHSEYGLVDIDNWKDVTMPPFFYKIMNKLKIKNKKNINEDDLPF